MGKLFEISLKYPYIFFIYSKILNYSGCNLEQISTFLEQNGFI